MIKVMRTEIEINGERFACMPTMGAMMRFKEETGKEVTEIKTDSVTELCTYLWCCVKAGAKREGKKFNLSLMDFADALTPEELEEWVRTVGDESKKEGGGDEKKSL